MSSGALYVVGTPIGNLADISFRAVEVLGGVAVIFCEDTRVTKKLLMRYSIDTPCISYHVFSKMSRVDRAISLLRQGKDVALVSDAGTPSISDPGVKFVRRVRQVLGDVVCVCSVPGASAVTAALSVSGAPASSFVFLGFPPKKKRRRSFFEEVGAEDRTVVCFESSHRLLKTLEALQECLNPSREVIVVREMTKVYEQVVAGTSQEVLAYYTQHPAMVRGEVVIVISSLSI